MEKPLVTVVTLTYRKFDHIYSTIESVLEQAYPKIEYIIADDGSDNFPKEEIEEYINSRRKKNIVSFSLLSSSKNTGTVDNINRSYRQALGEILIPLSADDIFYTDDVVEKIVNVFMHEECNVLVTSRMICNEDGEEIKKVPSNRCIKSILKLNTPNKQHIAFLTDEFYDMASGSAMYIRKAFLESWGYFDRKYFLWEDGPFLTQYTKKYFIDTKYDIISIRYRLGGISNGAPNPLMRKDIELYNDVDRVADTNIPFFTKRKIDYICIRHKATSVLTRIALYLKYPDVILSKLIYKLKAGDSL